MKQACTFVRHDLILQLNIYVESEKKFICENKLFIKKKIKINEKRYFAEEMPLCQALKKDENNIFTYLAFTFSFLHFLHLLHRNSAFFDGYFIFTVIYVGIRYSPYPLINPP